MLTHLGSGFVGMALEALWVSGPRFAAGFAFLAGACFLADGVTP
jgi:hypothetical protein